MPEVASKITTANLTSEFIGTYLLVLTVGCNVLGGSGTWAALSIASVLMVSVYSLGGVSGGHFNPAVTLAATLAQTTDEKGNKKSCFGTWTEALAYMAVQVVSGILAGLTYLWVHGSAFNLEPGTNFTGMHAGAIEILYTFMLCFTVLRVACSKAEGANEFFGLAIGFVIVAGGYAGGWISKGAFNPAVAIGVDVASAGQGIYWCLMYTVFEFIGAALAAGAFMFIDDSADSSAISTTSKFVSEFIGTFFLVLTVGLNVLGQSPAPALSIAASLMVMIYALGKVSGGHFNPAVTTAIALVNKDWSLVHIYYLAQISGGIVAGLVYTGICGSSVPLGPGAGHGWGAAAFAEIIYTFVLCFVVLNVAVHDGMKTVYGLAIGFVIVAGGYAIGSVSGGSLNPAVSFGLDTSHATMGGSWMNCLAYTLFELAGAGLAAGLFSVCRPEAIKGAPPTKDALPYTKSYGTI